MKQEPKILTIVRDIYKRTKGQTFPSFKERVESLNSPTYSDMFAPIQTVEDGDLILFRYGRYTDVLNDEVEDFGDAWETFWLKFNGLYRELRSIVIDVKRMEVALYPFDKFFNINELPETSEEEIIRRIENATESVEFSDKLDGSMVSARYYGGRIVLTGSKSLDPEQSWRLKENYRMVKNNSNLNRLITENPQYTLIFESITKADAHVVKYEDDQMGMHLIGIRDMRDYSIRPYSEVIKLANQYGVQTTTVFDKRIEEIMSSLDDKTSDEAEGFVANIDGFMVKIKYSAYCKMHGILGKLSSINLILQSIAEGTIDDLYSKVPTAYRSRIDAVVRVATNYIRTMEEKIANFYEKHKHLPLKEYALTVQSEGEKGVAGYLFAKYKGLPYNVLKKGSNGYKKLTELGVKKEDYISIFDEVGE